MKRTPSSLVMLFVPLWSVNISLQVMSFTLKMKAGASTWFEPEGSKESNTTRLDSVLT